MAILSRGLTALAVLGTAISLGGCGRNPWSMQASLSERECMARAMYFESNRSSEDGMLAVGTVVMNRVQSPRYPKSVCAVVGQERQFADGALSKPVESRSYARALKVADSILAGERHDKVGAAMFFHTAGYTFPYRNMAYVTAAGGNVFYEKKTPGTFKPIDPATLVARAEPVRPEPARARPDGTKLAAAPAAVPGSKARNTMLPGRAVEVPSRTKEASRGQELPRWRESRQLSPGELSTKRIAPQRPGSVTIAGVLAKDEGKPKRMR